MKRQLKSNARTLSRLRSKVTTDQRTSARMKLVRRHGTAPELVARSLITSIGIRYRLGNKELPGSPDIANRAGGWAVFVHGCFWHGHASCRAARLPRANAAFWAAKIADNVTRDKRKLRELRALGYRVAVLWECELKKSGSRQRITRKLAALILRT